MHSINSLEYWEERFSSSDWSANNGRKQTAYFYNLLMRLMPQWAKQEIAQKKYEVVDFGCAEGQGLPILAAELGTNIKGVDFSESAIKNAAELYPSFQFEVGDIWKYTKEQDVSVVSNVIEHFDTPFTLLKHIAGITKKYIVVMIPLEEVDLMPEHKFTFFYNNIPVSVGNFNLVYFTEHDCRNDEEQIFLAKQVFLLYSSDNTVSQNLSISSSNGLHQLLEAQRKEQKLYENIISALSEKLHEAENRLNNYATVLQNDVKAEIHNTNNYVAFLQSEVKDALKVTEYNVNTFSTNLKEQLKSELLNNAFQTQNFCEELSNVVSGLEQSLRNEIDSVALQLEQLGAIVRKTADESRQRYAENVVEAIDKKNLEIQNLTTENARLVSLYNDVDSKFLDLVNRFNNLNDAYGLVVEENAKIKTSRTYRFAKLTWKIAAKLHLVGLVRFLLAARYTGLKQALKARKIQKKQVNEVISLMPTVEVEQKVELLANEAGEQEQITFEQQINDLNNRRAFYAATLGQAWSETAREIADILANRKNKGIIVYPHAVHWEPVQRPHHLLRAFAEEEYICFFCESGLCGKGIEEKYPNVFVVYGEEHILPVLQNKCPVVMITWHMQVAFVDALPQKVIWFDLLDNLEFFSGGGSSYASSIYNNLIANAQVVSYSADNLKAYLLERKDVIKLNNGVMLSDFSATDTSIKIDIMEEIKKSGKKVIGYYGAIEEWFDKEAIRTLLEKTDFEIVLIGRVGIDLEDLANQRLHTLGIIPYAELGNYAKYFDVAMIPFIKNKLTDSVSPVKFYEYVAQGIPVLSADIQEMRQYVTDQVCIYHNTEELVEFAYKLCNQTPDIAALKSIAENNTWTVRAQHVRNALVATPVGLQALADFTDDQFVSVETVTFFKYDGTTYYSGGAERYLLDLQEVCSELNIPYRVYQYGEYNWVRFYNNVEVMGMTAKENDVNLYTVPLVEEMDRTFIRETVPSSKLSIYSPFYLLMGKRDIQTLGISHGISWDSEFNHYTDGNLFWQTNKKIIDAASHCDQMISVDTNTCNWFQTLDYDTGRKIHYIPNYVDNEEFSPREDYLEPRDKVIITYPRRLYGARGLYVVLDVIDDILERYPNAEFHFVGKGFEQDTKHVEKKIAKWGDRVRWYSKTPSQMHEVYKMADVSLVPTMYSEGTSLSCLEALSSGNVVIATRVGGLTDLILSDYNGKLVEPTGESIKEALFDLLDHPEKMRQLKKNAVETAKAFSKAKWKKEWKKIIAQYIADGDVRNTPSRCMIQLKSEADLKNPATLEMIREHLEDGWYVYVACKNNPMRYNSYKRLQYIDLNEDLYFTPEKTIRL